MQKVKLFLVSLISRLLYFIVVIFFGYVIYNNIGDYTILADTLSSVDLVLLAWLVILGFGNVAVLSSIFKYNFGIFKQEISIIKILPDTLSLSFLSISNPFGNFLANSYMIRKFIKRGYSYIKTVFSFLLTQFAVNLSFLPILVISLIYLNSVHKLESGEVFAVYILLALNLLYFLMLLLVLFLPNFSIKVSGYISTVVNSFAKFIALGNVIDFDEIKTSIQDIQSASSRIDKSLLKIIKSLVISLSYHIINIIILYLSFQSFGFTVGWEILLSVYSIIYLFTIVSPTPQGIGVVEGLAILGAISLSIPSQVATLAVLTYRVITIWMPAIIGMLIFRRFRK